MVTIPTGLYNDFYNLADLFITEINASSVELIFPIASDDTNNYLAENSNNVSAGLDLYGGRSPDVTPNSHQKERSGGFLNNTGVNIDCRVYWSDKEIDKVMADLNLENSENVCKIITYADNIELINSAIRAVVLNTEGHKVPTTIIKAPLLYGLGPVKRYCMSFWKEEK